MKQKILLTLLASTLTVASFCSADTAPTTPSVNLSTDQAKLSYVFGLNMGTNLRTHKMAIDQTVFMQGLNQGLSGTAPLMTPAQIKEVLTKFQKEMMAKQAADLKVAAEKNLQDGRAFMKNFVEKFHAMQIDSDLAYRIISSGNGPKPGATDTVSITYEGKLPDGTVFDSTKRNGDKPVSLPLNQVIPGMQKILSMMPVGSTWEVVMSPKVAYGEKGVPMSPIGPNETLMFTLSLKSTKPTTSTAMPNMKMPAG